MALLMYPYWHRIAKGLPCRYRRIPLLPLIDNFAIIIFMRFTLYRSFFICLALAGSIVGMAQVRIVCMGNSITQGKINPVADSITEKSYRPWLWYRLLASGIKVDMVGYNPFYFLQDSTHKAPSSLYSEGIAFDNDNDAYYGITSDKLLRGSTSTGWTGRPLPSLTERLNDPQRGYTPDMALLHIGTNDADSLVHQSVDNIASIIQVLRQRNPRVVVFLAKLVTGWKAVNQHIDRIAAANTTKGSPVIVVDMTTGFVNDPKDPGSHTFDWVHPNERGQQWMADRWFAAIAGYLERDK